MSRREELVAMQVDLKHLQLLRTNFDRVADEVREKYDMGSGGNSDDVIAELHIRIERLTNDFNTTL